MTLAETIDSPTDRTPHLDLAVPHAMEAHANAIKCSLMDMLKRAGGQDA